MICLRSAGRYWSSLGGKLEKKRREKVELDGAWESIYNIGSEGG